MKRNKPTKNRRQFPRHVTRAPNARTRRALLELYRAAFAARLSPTLGG